MSVMFVEPVLEGRADLTVRVIESGEFVRCVPMRGSIRDHNVIGWIGTNLVLVDQDDIDELAGVLDVIAVESWRPKVIQGGRQDAELSDRQFAPKPAVAAMDA